MLLASTFARNWLKLVGNLVDHNEAAASSSDSDTSINATASEASEMSPPGSPALQGRMFVQLDPLPSNVNKYVSIESLFL